MISVFCSLMGLSFPTEVVPGIRKFNLVSLTQTMSNFVLYHFFDEHLNFQMGWLRISMSHLLMMMTKISECADDSALKCMHREHAHPECFVVLCHLSYLCYEVWWEIVWNCCRTATIMASGLFSDVLELVKCKVYTTNVIGQCDQLLAEGVVAGLCNRFKVWMTSCNLFGIVSESWKSFQDCCVDYELWFLKLWISYCRLHCL